MTKRTSRRPKHIVRDTDTCDNIMTAVSVVGVFIMILEEDSDEQL